MSEVITPNVDAAAGHLLSVFPVLEESGQRIALALYRALSQGTAVAPGALAAQLRLPVQQLSEQLGKWPGIYYDDEQRVIGFWGLAIRPMAHRLRIGDRQLYAWCAWDTLFLPELIAATVDVESACHASGDIVRLTVTPTALVSAKPADTVVSFVLPDSTAVHANVISSFCHYVHFFRTREAAQPWLAARNDGFILSLAEAYELGRRINRVRYGWMASSDV